MVGQTKKGPRRKNGEGSVYQRSQDGRWVAKLAWAEEGEIRSRYVYKNTEEEAWQYLYTYMLHARTEARSPGRILLEGYMYPQGITQEDLALSCGVTQQYISQIVNGQRRISPALGLQLAYRFGTDKYFWAELQARYEVDQIKYRELLATHE